MDKKSVFIIVLAVALVLAMVFRPSKGIDTYEDEINELKVLNEQLSKNNDSLGVINDALSVEIKDLMDNVDSTQAALADTEDKLKDLENGKGKVSGYVSNLNADGVANELANYLNRR